MCNSLDFIMSKTAWRLSALVFYLPGNEESSMSVILSHNSAIGFYWHWV